MIPAKTHKPEKTAGKIGFGGGCHWCTEAYFQSLVGVTKTEQGWISAAAPHDSFSEAVIVHYNPALIPLDVLVNIHLHTHACTKNHSMREKYRSAVYAFTDETTVIEQIILDNQAEFEEKIITMVLSFRGFRPNAADQLNYYQNHKDGVFCERYIHPKLQMIQQKFGKYFQNI